MAWLAAAIPIVTQVVGGFIGDKNQGKAAKDLDKIQKPLLDAIEQYLGTSPEDIAKGALGYNVGASRELLPEVGRLITGIAKSFTDAGLQSAGRASDFFTNASVKGSRGIGVDPSSMIGRIVGMLGEEDAQAQALRSSLLSRSAEEEARGRSMRTGTYYDTDVGRQATQNLFRQVAPMLSSRGLDAFSGSAFAGAPSLAENRGITAFLRNAEQTARYGDQVMANADQLRVASAMTPFQMRDTISSRLGGVVDTGLRFGMTGAASGLDFGTRAAATGAGFGAQLFGASLLPTELAASIAANQAGVAGGVYTGNLNAATQISGGAGGSFDFSELGKSIAKLFQNDPSPYPVGGGIGGGALATS